VIDLLIAGGGPAGLVTALHARRAGLDVAVVEPRPAPIDKACGEGLMPGAVAALAELGVRADGQPFRGIRYCAGARTATADFRNGVGRGVRRADLHAQLWAAAGAAGVELVRDRVTAVNQSAGAVVAAGLRARYLVAADGLHSPVRRLLGIAARPAGYRRWGQRAHFAVAPWSDHVEVHWGDRAEVYVTPLGPHCTGVAVLSDARAPFADQLAGFPALRARLPTAPVDGVRAAGPLRQRVPTRVAGRVLLVGDAAGYVDALTGEGLAIGFASARALVERVVAGDPAAYEDDFRRITRNYRVLTGALLAAGRVPALRRNVVPLAQRAPWLFGAAVNRLAR
jgi:flavin-dependent dehydrogenase